MLKIVITLNKEEKGKIVKEGILYIEEDGKGEVTQIQSAIRREREAVLAAVNQAFDKLEGIAQATKTEKKPITVSAPKATKTDDENDDDAWMQPAFSGQKIKFKGNK